MQNTDVERVAKLSIVNAMLTVLVHKKLVSSGEADEALQIVKQKLDVKELEDVA